MNDLNLKISLEYLRHELQAIDTYYFDAEWAIFGSTSLIMRGILNREPGDIDIHLDKRVWGALLSRPGWFVETPKAGDPPILSNEICPIPIHAFFDWSDENVMMNVPKLISDSEVIELFGDKWRVIPVLDALAHKKFALAYGTDRVQKHVPDIEVIERWLENNYALRLS